MTSPIDQYSLLLSVNTDKLSNGTRKSLAQPWLDLIKCHLTFGNHSEAAKAYERATLSVNAAWEKERLVVDYSKLVTTTK